VRARVGAVGGRSGASAAAASLSAAGGARRARRTAPPAGGMRDCALCARFWRREGGAQAFTRSVRAQKAGKPAKPPAVL